MMRTALLGWFLMCSPWLLAAAEADPIATALRASVEGRLRALPAEKTFQVEAIAGQLKKHETKGYGGEFLPKWLMATTLAAQRTGDAQLRALALDWGGKLIAAQPADGYLGTYAPAHRRGGWDWWNQMHAILALARLEALDAQPGFAAAAARGAQAFLDLRRAASGRSEPFGGLPNRWFIAALAALPPAQREPFIAVLADESARVIPAQSEREDPWRQGGIAGWKYYEGIQIAWAGLEAARAMGDERRALRHARLVDRVIAAHHLAPIGSPWGDFEHLNHAIASSAYRAETCGAMAWIRLQRALLERDGDARHAEHIERVLWNHLIGAQRSDGLAWDGHPATNWSGAKNRGRELSGCCAHSGPLALEEAVAAAFLVLGDVPTLAIPLVGEHRVGAVRVRVDGDLAGAGAATATLLTASASGLRLRRPAWLADARCAPALGERDGWWLASGPLAAGATWRIAGALPFVIEAQPWSPHSDTSVKERQAVHAVRPGAWLRRGPCVYGAWGTDDVTLPAAPELEAVPTAAPAGLAGPACIARGVTFVPWWQVARANAPSTRVRVLLPADPALPAPPPPPVLIVAEAERGRQVSVWAERGVGGAVVFTIDGSEPGADSPVLTATLLGDDVTLRARWRRDGAPLGRCAVVPARAALAGRSGR